jgi:hypothetical protein
VTDSASRSRRRDAALATILGVAVLAGASALPNVHLLDVHQGGDTALYATYGERIVSGQLPYRDFYVEYPPGALPAFVVPTIGAKDDFAQNSKYLQWTLAALTVLFVAITLTVLGAGRPRLFTSVVLVGLAPVALGYVTFTRYDWWPAALTAAALAALVAGWMRSGHAVLAVAVSAKVYPAALVPLTLAQTWRTQGLRRAVAAAACLVAVLAAIVLPFAVIAPGGVGDSLYVQFRRPLQIESLGASFLLLAHGIGSYAPRVVSGSGSDNLAGSLPGAMAALTSVTEVLLLISLWVVFARTRRTAQQLVDACVVAGLAYLVLGKVLSPQYLIWLVPLVPLLSGRVRLPAAGLFGVALVLTQVYFQFRYHEIVHLEPLVWVLVARDLVLLALLVLVSVAVGRDLLGETRTQPEPAAPARAPAAERT